MTVVIAQPRAGLPQPHPVPTTGDLLWPTRHASAVALLATPGLELTLNGRGALFRVFNSLRDEVRNEVLVPAFHCPSVVAPLLAAGFTPVFYGVTRDLGIDWPDLAAQVGARTRAVLVIHFFGYATDMRPLQAIRASGVEIVEDWSHSFLRIGGTELPGSPGNHRVYSFWKLLSTHVGGAWLRPVSHAQPEPPLPAAAVQQQLVLAKRLLEDAVVHRGPARLARALESFERWRAAHRRLAAPPALDAASDLQRNGERYYPFDARRDAVRMPWWINRMIAGSDLDAISRRRCRHHQAYAQALSDCVAVRPWRTALPEAVPWVFPVLVEGRDQLDKGWRARGVPLHTFGIYLHSALFRRAAPRVVADALYLADRLLCLAVHQDLNDEHVRHACQVLLGRA